MNEKIKKTELLAPAGSFDALRAAVNAGADAVYMGGKSFGARAYAENPDEKGIQKAIEFCHIRGRKLYLTVNTLLKYNEISSQLYGYLLPFYEAGLDAVIVQDIGVMEFIGRNFPGLDIHVSTQCSLTMAEGIEGIRSLLTFPESITRIVPARELSLEEIRLMRANTSLEMEVFIHGALCVCYSGQCLLSSLAGGRSGNRGRCAQPCRRLYEAEEYGRKGYFLSPKDMCTLERIGDLIEAGVDSFKIEGRMKSPEYVAATVKAYRDVIDSYYGLKGCTDIEDEKEKLKEIYNRGGFNSGYLNAHNAYDMMSIERPGHFGVCVGNVTAVSGRKAFIKADRNINQGDVLELRDPEKKNCSVYEFTSGAEYKTGDIIEILTMKERLPAKGMYVFRTRNQELLSKLDEIYLKKDVKLTIDMEFYCLENEPVRLKAYDIEVTGNIVEKARNSALTYEGVKAQLAKLGNTDFEAGNIEIKMDPDVFVPNGELNRLRRELSERLKESILGSYQRNINGISYSPEKEFLGINENDITASAYISTFEQLDIIIREDRDKRISDIYMDIDESAADRFTDMCRKSGRAPYFVMPRILRAGYYESIRKFCMKYALDAGFLVTNYEGLRIATELGLRFRTDSNIYTFNPVSAGMLNKAEGYTLPYELNQSELKCVSGKGSEMIIYGLIPVMVSAQCVYKSVTGKCEKHGIITLKDEKGYPFKTKADCRYCYNRIYNPAVLNLLHKINDVKNVGCARVRLDLTLEDENEVRLIVNCLNDVLSGKKYTLPDEIMGLKCTNGHFGRGVE